MPGSIFLVDSNQNLLLSDPGSPGVLQTSDEVNKATYSIGADAVTPAATPTDIVTLIGSATKKIRVKRVTIVGLATTAGTLPIQLVKRSTANTAGTKTNPTPVPHDSGDAAATAVVNQYSANPTVGTSVGVVRSGKLDMPLAGALRAPIVWDFSTRNGKGIVLNGVAESLSINGVGGTVPAGGTIGYDIEWTEE